MEKTDYIGLYINIASQCIRRKMDSYSAPLGLSGIQMRILGLLDKAEKRNQFIYQRDIEKNFGPFSVVVLGKFRRFPLSTFFIYSTAPRFFPYLQQIFNALLGLFLLKKIF